MTTNKPEVVKYIVPKHQAWDVRTLVSPKLPSEQLMVLASDYDALQTELERWKKGSTIRDEQNEELHQYVLELKTECDELKRALSESRADDGQAMHYLKQVREIVGGDDFPDMVERCRKLVK